MVLDGVVGLLWIAMHIWLLAVSVYACASAKIYKKHVAIFWACQLAIWAAQIFITSSNYVTPIPWMLIYFFCGVAYLWFWSKEQDSNVLWLGILNIVGALFCLAYIYLSGRHDRSGDLNYVFTIGLNLIIVPQGALIFNGARIQNRNGG